MHSNKMKVFKSEQAKLSNNLIKTPKGSYWKPMPGYVSTEYAKEGDYN